MILHIQTQTDMKHTEKGSIIYRRNGEYVTRIYRRRGLSSEIANKYLQAMYKTAAISPIGSRRRLTDLWRWKVLYVSFFQDLEENKLLRESYEDYFIDKFKLLLN